MRSTLMLALTAALFAGPVSSALARTQEVPCLLGTGEKGLLVVSTAKTDGGGSLVIRENEQIVFAEFSLLDELPVGAEVELWPQVEGDVLPWDLPLGEVPFERNFWITDERTGALLRYDVTQIARAWEAGTLPNLGFVLRIVNGDELGEQGFTESPGAFRSPKQATLSYRIQPVRPPLKSSPPQERDQRGKDRRAENESKGGK